MDSSLVNNESDFAVEEIVLSKPRGFCAGVDRAILIVENAIKKFSTPVYVKHEIVHNKTVVEGLKKKGVIFVEDLEDVPEGSVLVFSAHGVSIAVEEQANKKGCLIIDATCPLVKRVHKEVKDYDSDDYEIILIGHTGHAEIDGTAGRAKKAKVTIIKTVEDAWNFEPKDFTKIMLVTQTTLSLDDTKEVCDVLQNRFPALRQKSKSNICYATQNRQNAVKSMIESKKINFLLVVGSCMSSNSNRLRDIGLRYGIKSQLVSSREKIDKMWFSGFSGNLHIGITAGASSPESLVQEVVDYFKENGKTKYCDVKIVKHGFVEEEIRFHIPKIVRLVEKDKAK